MIRKPYSRREKKLLQELEKANKAVQDQGVYSGKLIHEIAEINKIKDAQKLELERLRKESNMYRDNFENQSIRCNELESAMRVVIALK